VKAQGKTEEERYQKKKKMENKKEELVDLQDQLFVQ
jgi:hypothetical protein